MGIVSWQGEKPRQNDALIAKNYLNAEELEALNRIVTAYLEFAGQQAMSRKLMHMVDWIAKLDDFLKLSDRAVLDHAGKVSHANAELKAKREYARFAKHRSALPSPVDAHFAEAIDAAKHLERARKSKAAAATAREIGRVTWRGTRVISQAPAP